MKFGSYYCQLGETMVVAIDGPAGTGKSTVASFVAEKTGFYHVNSGSLYRAAALLCQKNEIPIQNVDAVLAIVQEHEIHIQDGKTAIDGKVVEDILRSDSIDALVAPLSSISQLRDRINTILQSIAKTSNIVVEGRDMTTVVFPDAEVKIYLDATIEARAERRYQQGTSELSLDEIREKIAQRDEIDRNKQVGALQQSPDAWYLDSSHLTIPQVCAKVLEQIQRHT